MDRNKTKIINIVSNYSSVYGGNYIPSIIAIANKLSEESRVILSFPLASKDRKWMTYLLNNGFDIEFFDSRNSKLIRRDVKRINSKRKVSIVYTNFLSALLAKSLVLFKKHMKLIIHLQSDFTGGMKMPLSFNIKQFIADRILRRDALYICLSPKQKRNLKVKRCWQIPCGISIDRIPCKPINVDSFKMSHNIAESDYVFLIFAWSPFIKGLDVACNALELCLKKKYRNFKLMIVYGKDNGYEKCLNFVKSKSNYNYIKSNLVLVPPTEDVFSYYRIADTYISASRSEGFSYSALEALVMKKSLIVSDIDATKWSLEFESAFCYPVEDFTKLADLMISVQSKGQNLNFEKVKKEVLSKYSLSIWVDRVASVFDVLVK